MQDIVFYVAANETIGTVRDYSNTRNQAAPVLVLGVSACLRMRMFSIREGGAPYPIASFGSIIDWQWSMDDVFERNTSCKLKADIGGISVHTVTDTVNGETMDFTEFVIPISSMNTQEVAAWLGNRTMRSGLNGELDGYDENGNAVFVLQVENFTIRNRIAGLADPAALDHGFVTRPAAETMIQTAVSASAATKQDKLTSANAGAGISIGAGGTISAALTAGERMEIVGGDTICQLRYFSIEPAITAAANQTTTVVLSAGKAYEIHAVGNNAKVLLNREPPPSSRSFGLEGHAEIFVANTGYIQTGENVVLSQPLAPDAVNNCTVRFHDGLAIVSVEDHVAGHIVTLASGTGAGSLPYGLTVSNNEYIAFDATTNGTPIDLAGATTCAGEKHIVGNGYSETVISGGITCTGKTTVSNLSLLNVAVNGGTLTFGNAFIASGSTVSVSGGGLAIEKVTGAGSESVIDLGGSAGIASAGIISASNIRFINGSANRGGAFRASGGTVSNCEFQNCVASVYAGAILMDKALTLDSCTFTGCSCITGGAVYVNSASTVENPAHINSCVFSGNSGAYGAGIANTAGILYISNSVISGNIGPDIRMTGTTAAETHLFGGNTIGVFKMANGSAYLEGSNTVKGQLRDDEYGIGAVVLRSGAILDLTGNTNTAPVAPGGGITFDAGGATVQLGAAAGTVDSSYMLDNVTLPAGAKLKNTAVVDLGGTQIVVPNGAVVNITGATFTNGVGSRGGAFNIGSGVSADFTDVKITGNTATNRGGGLMLGECSVSFSKSVVSGNTAPTNATKDFRIDGATVYFKGDCTIGHVNVSGATVVVTGNNSFVTITGASTEVTISSGATINLTSGIYPGSGITLYGGNLGSATSIIGSAGQSCTFEDLEVHGTTISNAGIIYGATVYSNEGDDHEIWYTPDSGLTTSTVIVTGATAFEVPGGLMKITNT